MSGLVASDNDTFFVLRDCRQLLTRRLVEVARHAGVGSPSVLEAFADEHGAAFDELVANSRQDGFEQTNGLTASRISLVGNDDLEIQIHIGNLIARLKENERINLWQVQLRFMTLLRRPHLTAETNPAGLEPINCALWALCHASQETLEKKFERLDRLEEQLALELPEIYEALDSLLQQFRVDTAEIRPVQREVRQSPVAQFRAASSTVGASNPTNPLASLQQLVRGDSAPVASRPAPIGNLQIPGHAEDNALLNASTLAMLNQVMTRLAEWTPLAEGRLPTKSPAHPDHPVPEGSRDLLVRAQDIDLPAGSPAAVALDTLSAVFEAISANPDFSARIKELFGRLHIPFFRLAVLDESFFANPQHPVRQLSNRLGRAAIGLDDEATADHAVCRFIANAIGQLEQLVARSDANFQVLSDALEQFIAQRDRAIREASTRYVQLLSSSEREFLARTEVDAWVQQSLARFTDPTVRRFLARDWRRVMLAAALAGGAKGGAWTEADTTISDLSWSFQPKTTADERKKMLALVTTLIRRINAGLDAAGVTAESRQPFMDACFELQTSVLRATSAPIATIPPAPTADGADDENRDAQTDADEILQDGGILVHRLDHWHPTDPAAKPLPVALAIGDWVRIRLPDDSSLCGLYCEQTPIRQTILLFNPDWGYAVAISASQMAGQLQAGSAKVMSQAKLFDDAIAHALTALSPH